MKKILLLSVFLSFFYFDGFTQQYALTGGLNYGGPIPNVVSDSSSGKFIPGLNGGFQLKFRLSERFSFNPEIYYSFRGADYCQSYTKDTTVSIIIFGVPGEVPSFYTANVEGKVRLHYIDIPLLTSYSIGKSSLLLVDFSYLFKGKDEGNVRVVIGEGGFYDDHTESYNNAKNIMKWEAGIMAGFRTSLIKKLYLEIKIARSFRSLYKEGALNRSNNPGKLFNTYLQLSLGYNFLNKE